MQQRCASDVGRPTYIDMLRMHHKQITENSSILIKLMLITEDLKTEVCCR